MTKTVKRTILAILLLCVALSFACFAACGEKTPDEPNENQQEQQKTDDILSDIVLSLDGTSVVGLRNRNLMHLTIPSTYNDVTITSINDYAFYGCSSLVSVTIPDTVTSIGENAFYECISLVSITIGSNVSSIGDEAFENCIKLVEVINKSSLNITKVDEEDDNEEFGCIGKYALNIKKEGESEVVNKDGYLFYAYDNVNYLLGYVGNETGLTLPENYNGQNYEIYKGAFYSYNLMTSVTIPDAVTSIGVGSFNECTQLTSVTIGNGVTGIAEWAFSNCSLLESATIGNGVTDIGDGAFYECEKLTNISIGSSVTNIGEDAFYRCSSLERVTIPDSVTDIGRNAFEECDSLMSVTIGKNVKSIGDSAFYECYKLVEIINKSDNLKINKGRTDNGFIGYYALNVKTDGDSEIVNKDNYLFYTVDDVNYLFGYVGSETSITLPEKYNDKNYVINDYAFYENDFLTDITIGSGVTSIGDDAFRNCYSLTNVKYTGTIDQWVQIDFYESYSNPLYYAKNLYINNELVTEANITTATEINSYAFNGYDSLTSVTIGDSVTNIKEIAFNNCNSLMSVTIGKNVASIGDYAFNSCYKLVEVINKSENLTIDKGSNDNGYIGYYALNVKSEGTSDIVKTNDGYFFYTRDGGNCLLGYVGDKTELTLPANYNEEEYAIYNYAFYGCESLTDITIGEKVIGIGDSAFYGCDSLTSVTIGKSVTSIGDDAFFNCESLTSITIPDNVEYIGYYAFGVCTSLTSVTIGNGVKSIGGNAFGECTSLTEIKYNATECSDSGSYREEIFFSAGTDGTGIKVTIGKNVERIPSMLFGSYYSGYYRTNKIIEVIFEEGSVCESIGDSAFYNCSSLTSITIPSSVTYIGYGAFSGCSSLASITVAENNANYKSIDGNLYGKDGKTLMQYAIGKKDTSFTIPDSVTSVGDSAFQNCGWLTSVIIPDSVTSIGYGSFAYCSSLTSVTFENPNGWYVDGASVTLTDAEQNATYLTSLYRYSSLSRQAEQDEE